MKVLDINWYIISSLLGGIFAVLYNFTIINNLNPVVMLGGFLTGAIIVLSANFLTTIILQKKSYSFLTLGSLLVLIGLLYGKQPITLILTTPGLILIGIGGWKIKGEKKENEME